MTRWIIYTLLSLLTLSISLNLFQYSSTEVVCRNIDSRWKADLLYKMGHNRLDGDKDWIPCENLSLNHDK
jgi:hypothetical protein